MSAVMESDEISLWLCNSCRRQIFQEQIDAGEPCGKCGSRRVSPAPANWRYIGGYLFHNPSLIKKFLKENVFGSDPVCR